MHSYGIEPYVVERGDDEAVVRKDNSSQYGSMPYPITAKWSDFIKSLSCR